MADMYDDRRETDGRPPAAADADGRLQADQAPAPSTRPAPTPIVLHTFGRRPGGPAYGWSSVFSIVLHVTLIGLTLWLSRAVAVPHSEAVAVVFRRPAPRPPPPPVAETAAPRKGGRGISLPKAVARDAEPDMELTFAASPEPPAPGATGKWLGGVGTGYALGPGWSNGVEGGAIRRHSLARGPQEEDTGWDCGFPAGGPPHNVVVRIRVHVSAAGKPTHVTILRPGPPVFNDSARECALRQRFRAALDMEGNPTEGDRELGILFFYPGAPADAVKQEVTPPPPVAPPLEGPQPDLPVQLDESATPG